ncbi:MXAN_6640 family putative metalloprotease [Nocardioides rubriscoriae]|uniref:MXAN_6640 family putative metalloprotease n=1 Tax=Nocardioides rubriscoriae TaxID=642762 RepID=UPI0011E065FD|nr:MXAN_6640 family putative metalloprotease [Nocardioides rubriscoriae]
MPHRPARVRAAVALVASAALTSTLLASYAAPTASAEAPAVPGVAGAAPAVGSDSPGKAALASRSERRALSAVSRARAIASGDRSGDLTMALREVANTRTALTGADRAAAEALLKRPTDATGDGNLSYDGVPEQTPVCSADICVHYVATGPNAPSPTDADLNGVPDFVDTALATLDHVHDTYIAAGYREPLPDGTRGGNSLIDVYLGELGDDGLYGYCTSDQPETQANSTYYDRWAYCALDNDYSPSEFGTANTPTQNLQVTVAHEYFHATQFAYDRYEDSWLLEATATWAEDEVYDGVDDNLQYLRNSQLTQPRTPLDTFNSTGFHYGTWSFIRFLTEKFRTKKGALPRLVLDIFLKADGAKGKPDQYSWQAVNTVLRAKKTTGAAMLGRYAVANRRPAQSYSEGRANRYPVAPLIGTRKITARRGVRADVRLNHLTTATARVVPQGLTSSRWKLRLALDLAPKVRGSSVLVTSATKSGRITTSTVRLDRQGNAVKRLPFSSSRVAWVEVTLVNGSGRFRCFNGGDFSCQGTSRDNGLAMKFTATAVR